MNSLKYILNLSTILWFITLLLLILIAHNRSLSHEYAPVNENKPEVVIIWDDSEMIDSSGCSATAIDWSKFKKYKPDNRRK